MGQNWCSCRRERGKVWWISRGKIRTIHVILFSITGRIRLQWFNNYKCVCVLCFVFNVHSRFLVVYSNSLFHRFMYNSLSVCPSFFLSFLIPRTQGIFLKCVYYVSVLSCMDTVVFNNCGKLSFVVKLYKNKPSSIIIIYPHLLFCCRCQEFRIIFYLLKGTIKMNYDFLPKFSN